MTAPATGKARDWAALERRLQQAQAAAEHAWTLDAAETARILQQRASLLAREPVPAEEAAASFDVVEFLLAQERYAIAIEHVGEVHRLRDLTPLPNAPGFVLGIINLRGEMLSVIDIRRFFDLPQAGLSDLNKVIVLEAGEMSFGVLADAVEGVRRMMRAAILPVPPTLGGIREEYLLGVTAERVAVLDGGRLLGDDRLVVRETAE